MKGVNFVKKVLLPIMMCGIFLSSCDLSNSPFGSILPSISDDFTSEQSTIEPTSPNLDSSISQDTVLPSESTSESLAPESSSSSPINHEHDVISKSTIINTCNGTKMIDFYYCPICDAFFTKDGSIQYENLDDLIKNNLGHQTIFFNKEDSSCEKEGHIEYYYCSSCGKYFKDEFGLVEISEESIIIPKKPHNLIYYKAEEASCYNEGNIEHYYCSKCGKYFKDMEGTIEIPYDQVIIPKTDHTYSDKWSHDGTYHWHDSTCGHVDQVSMKGEHTYKDGICTVCGYNPIIFELSYDKSYYIIQKVLIDDENIYLPTSYKGLPIREMNSDCLANSPKLKNLYIDGSIEDFIKMSGSLERYYEIPHLFLKDSNGNYNEAIDVVLDMERVPNFALNNCIGIKTIEISDRCTSVWEAAFQNCRSLTSVTIGKNVNVIFSLSFINCPSLKEIIFKYDKFTLDHVLSFEDNSLDNVKIYTYSQENPNVAGLYWKYDENGNIQKYEIDSVYSNEWSYDDTHHWREKLSGSGPDRIDVEEHHINNNFICDKCGYNSYDFDYKLSRDGTYYIVTGISKFVSDNFYIPNTHLGKPVKGIAKGAFPLSRDIYHIRIIYVPKTITFIEEGAFECTDDVIFFEAETFESSNFVQGASLIFGVERKNIWESNSIGGYKKNGKAYISFLDFDDKYTAGSPFEFIIEKTLSDGTEIAGFDRLIYSFDNRRKWDLKFNMSLSEFINFTSNAGLYNLKQQNCDFYYFDSVSNSYKLIENYLIIPNDVNHINTNVLRYTDLSFIYIPSNIKSIDLDYFPEDAVIAIASQENEITFEEHYSSNRKIYFGVNKDNCFLLDHIYYLVNSNGIDCEIIGTENCNNISIISSTTNFKPHDYKIKNINEQAFNYHGISSVYLDFSESIPTETNLFNLKTVAQVSDRTNVSQWAAGWDNTVVYKRDMIYKFDNITYIIENDEATIIQVDSCIVGNNYYLPDVIDVHMNVVYPVVRINANAFSSCENLRNLFIPDSVKYYSDDCLNELMNIKVFFDTNTAFEMNPNDFPLYGDRAIIRKSGYNKNNTVSIDGILYYCAENGEAKILDVEQGYIFSNSIYFNGSYYKVTAIGRFAFNDTSLFDNNYLPETIETIDANAFYHLCCMNTLYLPSSLKSIGHDIIYDTNCYRYGYKTWLIYEGTKEQWDKIEGGSEYTDGFRKELHFAN